MKDTKRRDVYMPVSHLVEEFERVQSASIFALFRPRAAKQDKAPKDSTDDAAQAASDRSLSSAQTKFDEDLESARAYVRDSLINHFTDKSEFSVRGFEKQAERTLQRVKSIGTTHVIRNDPPLIRAWGQAEENPTRAVFEPNQMLILLTTLMVKGISQGLKSEIDECTQGLKREHYPLNRLPPSCHYVGELLMQPVQRDLSLLRFAN